MIRSFVLIAVGFSIIMVFGRCDSVRPNEEQLLVVEAFLDTGSPLPAVHVRHTESLDASLSDVYGATVADATVDLSVNGVAIKYRASSATPGAYVPFANDDVMLRENDSFELAVRWRDEVATAAGRIPEKIRIDSMLISVPSEPVAAVFVDSLKIDSLSVDAETGFLYPVEVTLWWPSGKTDDRDWIQTQIKPFSDFTSVVVDFFLLPEEVFPERDADLLPSGQRVWRGLYAIPVDSKQSPIPQHRVRLAIVRGDQSYADYAVSRADPNRREPVSNVRGALGIVAGVSVDSLNATVGPVMTGKRNVFAGR